MDLVVVEDAAGQVAGRIREDGDPRLALVGGLVLPEHVVGFDVLDRAVLLELEEDRGCVVGVDVEAELARRAGDDGRFAGPADDRLDRGDVDRLADEQGFRTVPFRHRRARRRDFPGQGQVGGLGRADVLDAALADESDDALEEIEEAPGAGVDDTGPGQDGQLLGRVGERSLGDRQGVGQQLGEVGHLLALFVEGFGPVVENGDHRALDGRHDGPPGVLDGPPRALGEPVDRTGGARRGPPGSSRRGTGRRSGRNCPGPRPGPRRR